MALWEALLASTKQISDGQIIPNGVDNLAVLMMMKLWTYPEKVEGQQLKGCYRRSNEKIAKSLLTDSEYRANAFVDLALFIFGNLD